MQIRNIDSIKFLGKTTLFTDFDATYFPFKREDITPLNAPKFKQMYLPFDVFEKQEAEKGSEFNVVITTGRSKNDLLHTEELIKKNNLEYHFPKGIISSNGANVFVVNNGEIKDVTPYVSDIDLFSDVERIIKALDGDISVVECKINGDKKTYGNYSSEFELEKLPDDKRNKYAAIARDGKSNLEIVFPKSVDEDVIFDKLKAFIEENNYPYTIEHYKDSPYTKAVQYRGDKKSIENANLILLKEKRTKNVADKFDTVKERLKTAIEEGDFIIVAGDAFNDEKMLNPMNYLDLFGIDTKDKTTDELLEDKNTIKALQTLPFRAIICGKNPDLDKLRELSEKLNSKSINIIHQAPDTIEDYPKIVGEILGNGIF